ncbi:type II/IV secretion system protein [Candidatus Uhrbacteria bacterium]|nr:type II/IV secretion system protein [Candidatus Uhrbacteria bacterium]
MAIKKDKKKTLAEADLSKAPPKTEPLEKGGKPTQEEPKKEGGKEGGKKKEAEKKLDFTSVVTEDIEQTRKLKLVRGIEELEKLNSITQLVDLIVRKAWESGASDIHIDPAAKSVLIRFRIDGILHDIVSLKKELQPLIITRIKVLSGLRTDEHFMAQDGRFRVTEDTVDIDLRVSIVPTYHGENVVMRLLVGEARALGLGELGLSERDLGILHRYIKKPYGMILSTGPTGSGKTTSLYSVLRILNSREISIITIEDPIEYAVSGITQIQVNTQTNLTFAAGLRSIVRQDPNVIMVGEIRDEETAGIAVNAAMTGHLLLSTLHTNDASTTLPRLLDMSIEPFLIASTVNIAIGQRLVRKLCASCRVQYTMSAEERTGLTSAIPQELLNKEKKFWRAEGCDKCNDTGYIGRIGIFEILEVTDEIRLLIMRRANADEIHQAARKQGMTTMLEDGFTKAIAGITSIAEILRVIHD